MTKTEDIIECVNCGEVVDASTDTSTYKTPCSNCGSTSRRYLVKVRENLQILDGWEMKGKRPGEKKPFFEEMSKPDYSHSRKELVKKERLIDRDNDKYLERITVYQTDETIHHCEEPLSKHVGHGLAKNIKK